MKVYLFIFSFFFFLNNSAVSQITKGNLIVGGNFSFNRTSNTNSNNIIAKQSVVSITPMVGYFLKDKFVLGLRSELNNYSGSITGGNRNSSNRLDFGPFLRYYFLPVNDRVNLFAESAYLLSLIKSYKSKWSSGNGFLINVGSVIYLNKTVGLEFTLGYSSQYWTNSIGNFNNFRTGIGFQIHLEKAN
jgi:hypothetical protein